MVNTGNNISNLRAADPAQPDKFFIQSPSVELPKGGGAIKSISEKFSVNAINGTSSFSIPLPASTARDFGASLTLNYNSGSGNGIFGLGWAPGLGSVRRKTEKELPRYYDTIDSDTYILAGAEDLVPEFKNESNSINEYDSADGLYTIRRYKLRIEAGFTRIERWTEKTTSLIHWKITSAANNTIVYGKSSAACIADPTDPLKIFEWLPEYSFDDRGNCMLYEYKKEDGAGLDKTQLHNRNRSNGLSSFTGNYLKRIRQGNITPYKNTGELLPTVFMFETVLDYGEHDAAIPFNETGDWDFRSDAFSGYRSGFEIRTCRLCKRALLYHHFDELPGGSALVRSMAFAYDDNKSEGFNFLRSITETGYTKHIDGSYTFKSLPPVNFNYQVHEWNTGIQSVFKDDLLGAPTGPNEPLWQFVDLFSEGLSGMLTEQGGEWFYKSNLGNGSFTPATIIAQRPSFDKNQKKAQLQDLAADGTKQLVSWESPLEGFFELSGEMEQASFQAFTEKPNIDFADPNTKFIDLDADGKADILISQDEIFTWYTSEGKAGFSFAGKLFKAIDEEKGPAVVFHDEVQSVFLADMTGDGLTDIVRIKNAEVCYWPNMGYGKFGAKVSMDDAPVFDLPDQFNPALIRLADADGSGTTDLIYLGQHQFRLWLNQQGNRFTQSPVSFDPFPEITNHAQVSVTDLLGNGMACIVWNSGLPNDEGQPLKYIDLFSSKKPHLLTGYQNNLGKEAFLEYAASTKFYIEDKLAGTPWVTKLHFPVQCLVKVTTNDLVTGSSFCNSYSYHHGYYDHPEREFRGFGRVEQMDTESFQNFKLNNSNSIIEEDLYQPPVKTITWFHTGAYFDQQKILDQFSHEYHAGSYEFNLPAPALPDGISDEECREALRACKGMMLRQEVYGMDNSPLAENPYTVTKKNTIITLLQPRLKNKYAVFYVHESEAANFYYERNTADPRISHSLNLQLDDKGNVLKSASVVYGRKISDPALPPEIQAEQSAVHVVFTENDFTNDIDIPVAYRLRLTAQTKTYELTNAVYNSIQQFNVNNLLSDFAAAASINYEMAADGSLQKRLIENVETIYLADDLVTPLPAGQTDTKGFVYQAYKLALTPPLIADLYNNKVSNQMLSDAGYLQRDTTDWWICSGKKRYLDAGETADNAIQRFYLPMAVADTFGTETQFLYDKYNLFIIKTQDVLQNSVTAELVDYCLLRPVKLKDANNNFSETTADELGMVICTSAYGDEGDGLHGDNPLSTYVTVNPSGVNEVVAEPNKFLQGASTFFFYDVFAWINRQQPVCFACVARETHVSELGNGISTNVFLIVGYSNGLGQSIQTKVQAEPGEALKWEDGVIKTVDTSPGLRWVGTGRTILNNKGNAVKQYEPFFSTTFEYEAEAALVEIGYPSITYYDPLGRVIKVEHADGTFSKTSFDAWKQLAFDENDTVLESSWYSERNSPDPSVQEPVDPEQRAAWLTAKHANTAVQSHTDSLGRTIYTVADNAAAGKYAERVVLDIENNKRSVIDARGNIVMQYKYDIISREAYHRGMDNGEQFIFTDAVNKPVYAWDSRRHRFRSEYDQLHRPTNQWLLEGTTTDTVEKLIGFVIYGEGQHNDTQLNMRGKIFQSYDQSGLIQNTEYDFKGNIKSSLRQLAAEYKYTADWNIADKNTLLETETFSSASLFDAMNRPVSLTLPDNSIIMPSYNEANLLNQVNMIISGQASSSQFVQKINYNAKSQRETILYGNNTLTSYTYNKINYRVNRILTTRNKGADILQDLNYTYDPVGNITQTVDNAQQTIFFNNAAVDAGSKYVYDAIYRIIYAQGREHAGQNAASSQFDTDKTQSGNSRLPLPGDINAMQRYEEQYDYDAAGNMLQMIHNAGNGIFSNKWTRNFNYSANNNQLSNIQTGNDVTSYQYDAHGNMLNLQNGNYDLSWNYADRLQQIDLGGGGTAYYVYDTSGQRTRKIIVNGNLIKERIYLGSLEIYRETANGARSLERETIRVMDDQRCIALIETRVKGDDNGLSFLIRYQYSNHLGTACLELTDAAEIISYEEYYPFGSTSYQAMRNQTETAKRYRYTGKERDEESGLYYHGARYYAPWLCRWTAADPIGTGDGLNVYVNVHNNPVRLIDSTGKEAHRLSYEERMANSGGVQLLTRNNEAGIDMTGIGEAAAPLEQGTIEASVTVVADKPKFTKRQQKDPEVSDPEALKYYEGVGVLELGDVTQFAKGTWNGPASWVGARQFSVDPYHKAGEWMGNEFGKNMVLEVGSAGIGYVFKGAGKLRTILKSGDEIAEVAGDAFQLGAKETITGMSKSVSVDETLIKVAEETVPAIKSGTAAELGTLVGKSPAQMRREAARAIARTENHPLKFLLNSKNEFRSSKGIIHPELIDRPDILEMGHITSNLAKGEERIMLQTAWDNQFSRITVEGLRKGAYIENTAIDIGGIAVDLDTATWWEKINLLKPGTVANAPRLIF